jgi:hypothetical protein
LTTFSKEILPDNRHIKLVQTLSLLWEDERNRRRQVGMPESQPSQPAATQFLRENVQQDEIEQAMIKRAEELMQEEELIIASQVSNLYMILTHK